MIVCSRNSRHRNRRFGYHPIAAQRLPLPRCEVAMEKPTLEKFPQQVLARIDIEKAFIVSRLIVAAEKLQLFRLLHGKRMKAEAIGRALKIHPHYLEPFLNAFVGLQLLDKKNSAYSNTPMARKYFIAERSIYWTRQYTSECLDDYDALTVLEQALATGKQPRSLKRARRPLYVVAMHRDPKQAENFTHMLFYLHRPHAEALAKYLDLSQRHALLDVGGGSGVMSIALAKKNPQLRATILDIKPVCKVAAGIIRRAGLGKRVRTLVGNFHRRLPEGYDVIMMCDIGPVSERLLRSVYRSLPAGGLLVLVDRYLSEDGTQPLDRLVEYFAGSSFGVATWKDMVNLVEGCEFTQVKAENVYRDVWFITGVKPEQRAR
jgi:3-hydroxy-5-methyl-1-naphthoate 3-O-methyltransferase